MDSSLKQLCIFAKAAVPGEVKTRLIPSLGAEGAALLHAALVERAIETAQRCDRVELVLCGAPDASHSFFLDCAEDFGVELTSQGEGDLGVRMLSALSRGLASADRCAILGSDCPSVTPKDIHRAFDALDSHDVALIPAEDGGYVLIAVKRTDMAMFDHIDWGTATVFAQQCDQLSKCDLRTWIGETRWDVDVPEDLAKLDSLIPPLHFFRP